MVEPHGRRAGSRLARRSSRAGRPAVTGLVGLVIALAVSSCGDDGDSILQASTADSIEHVVVESPGGDFDAEAVYRHAAPGVVTIRSVFNPESDSATGPVQGLGSGFVVGDRGEIVTNAHVVTDADSPGAEPLHEAREVYVQFPDRNQVRAAIVGLDPFADVALLEVDPEGLDLSPLELGDASELEVGQPVATLGSPFDQRQSLSVGIVSAIDRSIPSLTEFQIDGAIQTDASINPGNSGGPLLDAEGNVLGINQQIDTTSGGNQGVGFAVPIDLVSRAIDQLRADGTVEYAYIGVTAQPLYPQLADELGIDSETGALLATVVEGGPAAAAGLRGGDETIDFQGQQFKVGGDVVTAIDGEPILGEADLPRIISRRNPGDRIVLDVIRDGDQTEIEVVLGSRPAAGAPLAAVAP